MFTTLLESRTARARRTGGTTFSAIIHGALIALGVASTTREPRPMHADEKVIPPVFIPVAPKSAPPQPLESAPRPDTPRPFDAPRPVDLVIVAPTITPTSLPPITVGREIPPDRIAIGGAATPGAVRGLPAGDGAVDVSHVERAPSLVGQPREPRYPSILRESGTNGQVVLRFVIDTLGRAEMGDITVTETTHALFTDAVLSVLRDYRFSAGEVGGRKVRTMVQMPFSFSIR